MKQKIAIIGGGIFGITIYLVLKKKVMTARYLKKIVIF